MGLAARRGRAGGGGQADRPGPGGHLRLRAELPPASRRGRAVPARAAARARRDPAPLRGDRGLRGRRRARRLGTPGDRAPPRWRPLGPPHSRLPAGVGIRPHRRPRLPGLGHPLRGPVRRGRAAGRAGRGRGTRRERRTAHTGAGPGAAARNLGGRGPAQGAPRRRHPPGDRQVRLLDRPLPGRQGGVRRHGTGPPRRDRRRSRRTRPGARQGRAAGRAIRPDRPGRPAHDGLGADHPGVARRPRHRRPLRHLRRPGPPDSVALHRPGRDAARAVRPHRVQHPGRQHRRPRPQPLRVLGRRGPHAHARIRHLPPGPRRRRGSPGHGLRRRRRPAQPSRPLRDPRRPLPPHRPAGPRHHRPPDRGDNRPVGGGVRARSHARDRQAAALGAPVPQPPTPCTATEGTGARSHRPRQQSAKCWRASSLSDIPDLLLASRISDAASHDLHRGGRGVADDADPVRHTVEAPAAVCRAARIHS